MAREMKRLKEAERLAELEDMARLAALKPAQPDDYAMRLKTKVRAEIDSVLEQLSDESDPKNKEKLASALAKLMEAERKLDMRPAPANVKPSRERRAIVAPDPD